jgi:hypothetical protein
MQMKEMKKSEIQTNLKIKERERERDEPQLERLT